MEPDPRPPATHLPALDLLRFLAAFTVMLLHFMYSLPVSGHVGPRFPSLEPVLRYGYLAVDLFFMISGYVILNSARRHTLQGFIVARVSRLYPVFWLSCTLTFIVVRVSGVSPGPEASIKQFLFNLTMMHEFFGYAYVNPVYWTLTYDLTFYFLVAVVIACRLWEHLLWVIAGWLAYTLVAGPLAGGLFSLLFIPRYSAFFIAGMLFYLLRTQAADAGKVKAALAVAFVLALRSARAQRLVLQEFLHDPGPYRLPAVLGIIAGFFVIFCVIVYRTPMRSAHPLWAWLAQLTYPIYLLHPLGVIPLILLNGKVNPYILMAGTVSMIVGVSWGVYVVLERPGGRFLGQQTDRLLTYLKQTRLMVPLPARAGPV